MSAGWFKCHRGEQADWLLARSKNAFVLLWVIASRVSREGNARVKLLPGQAFIGDHNSYGMTEQEYRSAKKVLESNGIATFKRTKWGTTATLIDTGIFDANAQPGNGINNGIANGAATDGQRQSRINNQEVDLKILKASLVVFNQGKEPSMDEVSGHAEACGYTADQVKAFTDYNRDKWPTIRDWKKAFDGFAANSKNFRKELKAPHCAAPPRGGLPAWKRLELLQEKVKRLADDCNFVSGEELAKALAELEQARNEIREIKGE
jgi:hypothetical protein